MVSFPSSFLQFISEMKDAQPDSSGSGSGQHPSGQPVNLGENELDFLPDLVSPEVMSYI